MIEHTEVDVCGQQDVSNRNWDDDDRVVPPFARPQTSG